MLSKDQFSRRELCLLERTINYARKSRCTQRHAALIYKSGKVLSIANNKYHNDPVMFPVHLLNQDKEKIGLHAEVAALKGIHPSKARGATIFIARVKRDGTLGMSRPCSNCARVLRDHGVRKVIYTDESLIPPHA